MSTPLDMVAMLNHAIDISRAYDDLSIVTFRMDQAKALRDAVAALVAENAAYTRKVAAMETLALAGKSLCLHAIKQSQSWNLVAESEMQKFRSALMACPQVQL